MILTKALSGFFQLGYVTNNLQRGTKVLKQTFGISQFQMFDDTTLEIVRTRRRYYRYCLGYGRKY